MKKIFCVAILYFGISYLFCQNQVDISAYVTLNSSFSVSADAFFSTASGNVGISSAIPQAKLGIEGGIIATSSITAQGGFYGDGTNLTNVPFLQTSFAHHKATATVNMGGNDLNNVGSISGSSATFSGQAIFTDADNNKSIFIDRTNGNGVWARSTNNDALYGESTNSDAVSGYSVNQAGLSGLSLYNYGLSGLSLAGGGLEIGCGYATNYAILSTNGINYFSDDVVANSSITVSGTVDGRDVSADGTKLDAVALSTGTLRNETITSTAALVLADRTFTTLSTVTYMTSLSSVTYMRDLSTLTYVVNLSTLDYVTRTNFNLLAASTGTVDNSLKLNGHTYDTFVDTYTAQNIKGIKTHLDDIVVGNTTGDSGSVFFSSGDSVIDFADKGTGWGSNQQQIYSKDGNEITVKVAGADRVDFKASTTTVNNTLEVVSPTSNKYIASFGTVNFSSMVAISTAGAIIINSNDNGKFALIGITVLQNTTFYLDTVLPSQFGIIDIMSQLVCGTVMIRGSINNPLIIADVQSRLDVTDTPNKVCFLNNGAGVYTILNRRADVTKFVLLFRGF